MNLKPKLKSLNVLNELVGQEIPVGVETNNGGVGRFIHAILEEKLGVPLNHGSGADITMFGAEIKSHHIDSKAAITIGGMSLEYIKNTPYDQSYVKEKLQHMIFVRHNGKIILDYNIYDLTDPEIQDDFRFSYNTGRDVIINGTNSGSSSRIKGINKITFGYFEKKYFPNYTLPPRLYFKDEEIDLSLYAERHRLSTNKTIKSYSFRIDDRYIQQILDRASKITTKKDFYI